MSRGRSGSEWGGEWWGITHGPPLFRSREPHHRKKRSRGPKSDDDGFEIVPIEDPGEWVCTQRNGRRQRKFRYGIELGLFSFLL